MSEWIITWIIALAPLASVFVGVATLFVYFKLWKESQTQNAATRESLDLTCRAFLESHKPVLTVSVEKCKYFGDQVQEFDGEIVIDNCGTASAIEVNIRLRFNAGGLVEAAENITSIAIHPQIPYRASFAFPMKAEVHKAAHTKGNRVGMRADGSYKGVDGRVYTYNELQHYDPILNRFVPVHTG
jgi:hypothetical protein